MFQGDEKMSEVILVTNDDVDASSSSMNQSGNPIRILFEEEEAKLRLLPRRSVGRRPSAGRDAA